ncbi:hybrid sensor histidine kinase/response regulator [Teichococcus oryzae]|nr:PAS domain-containing sensor histidine kinase [Pseudoroseomonas oryzae]
MPGSRMAEAVRCHDWAATPLGPIQDWPPALRIVVDMMLASTFPKCLCWGPDLIAIHNDAFLPILGDKPALGRSFRDVWPEAWPSLGPICDDALAGKATFVEDFRLEIDRHGYLEEVFLTFCYSPVRDETGAVAGFMDTVMETTGKMVAERNLERERQRLDALNATLEQRVAERTADRDRMWRLSGDMMLLADFNGRIHAVNPAWTMVLGWTEAELIGSNIFDLLHPEDMPRTREAIGVLAAGRQVRSFDNRYRHRDGGYRWITWTASPGEGLIHAAGRDVTVEKDQAAALLEAEAQLRQSQKMEAVGQLTGGLAHDFNNLLTGITGSLDLIAMRLAQGQSDGLERYIDSAQRAAERAAALTHRLLAFSRRQPLDPRPVQPDMLVGGMLDLIGRTVGPAIQVETALENGTWPILCDANQLENALLNLCINARDAMPQGGTLVLSTRNHVRQSAPGAEPKGDYVAIAVRDTGTGMTPEVAARAFDPFFTTKPLGTGTGLGLSMIYGFAHQSGGEAVIETAPGEGTEVRLLLPRHNGTVLPARSLGETALPAEGAGETILLVEDEAAIRMLVADQLEDLGYSVLQAADGPSGLEILRSGVAVDLVISDIGLPGGMTGRQMAEAGLQSRPNLAVLFITGYAASAALGETQLPPNMSVLTKPFPLTELARRVRALLRGRGA